MIVTRINTTLRVLTFVLGIAVVFTMLQLYALINPAQGAALLQVSDTLSTSGTLGPSAPSVAASHYIVFTLPSTAQTYDGAGGVDQFTIYWDDTTVGGNSSGSEEFDFDAALAAADIDICIGDEGAACGADLTIAVGGGCTGEDIDVTINDGAEDIVFEVCAATVSIDADDVIEIEIGSLAGGTDRITNPTPTGSYPITIEFDNDGSGGAPEDEGETRVMILDQVTMTAEVETNLTCYISGLADGAGDVNGATFDSDSGTGVDGSASATAIDFGVVTPDDAAGGEAPADREVLGQELEVATNAANGFLWTIEADQRLTSAITATIDLFIDDAGTTTPSDWTNPSNSIADPDTWGHLGLTSEDDDLHTNTGVDPGDDFTDSGGSNGVCETMVDEGCWVGNYLAARNVFAHDGPANGDGMGGGQVDEGLTQIGWAIEVSSLQEAAADYNNTWTHICTPTF